MDLTKKELFKIIEWLVDNNHVKLLTPGLNIVDKIDSLNNFCALDETQAVRQNEDVEIVCVHRVVHYDPKLDAEVCDRCGHISYL